MLLLLLCIDGNRPKAQQGFDIALTELEDAFLFEAGSPAGAAIAVMLPLKRAAATDMQAAESAIKAAASAQTRSLVAADICELLFDNLEHPR
jgi:hypothetical protein